MPTPTKLAVINTATGIVCRYVGRKLVDKGSITECPPEDLLSAIEHFRLHGLPDDNGGNAA